MLFNQLLLFCARASPCASARACRSLRSRWMRIAQFQDSKWCRAMSVLFSSDNKIVQCAYRSCAFPVAFSELAWFRLTVLCQARCYSLCFQCGTALINRMRHCKDCGVQLISWTTVVQCGNGISAHACAKILVMDFYTEAITPTLYSPNLGSLLLLWHAMVRAFTQF